MKHNSTHKFSENILHWYDRNARDLPWRSFWKKSQDPYVVWVSEIMLQQTLIAVVIPAYLRFLKKFPNIAALAKATEEQVRSEVRGLGYYRRFGFLHRAARELSISKVMPRNFHEWKEVSGVGDYTAAAISSITLNEAVAVVDGNVERVVARLLALKIPAGSKELKVRSKEFVSKEIDANRPGDFNQAVMELGQLVCTPQNPKCSLCPVHSMCRAKKEKAQEYCPLPKVRRESEEISLNLVIPVRKGAVGVVMRDRSSKFLKDSLGFDLVSSVGQLKKIGSVKHTITHHKITAHVYVDGDYSGDATYIKIKEIEPQLVSNLDRKAFRLFEKDRGHTTGPDFPEMSVDRNDLTE